MHSGITFGYEKINCKISGKWMKLENILNEVTQAPKDKCHMLYPLCVY